VPEPWEWQLADIEELIKDRVQESLVLDYKASAALAKDSSKVSELSKDVSAFANSEGGTLVYGVTQDDQNYPKALDVGSDRGTISAEWISQVIDSRISPRIRGYQTHAIDLPSGKALFVIHVPQSETAHMADDNRYYRRSDCRSVPMQAYEVLDVMGRSKTADLQLEFRLASGATKLFVYAENFSPAPVPFFVAYIYLGERSGASHPNFGLPLAQTFALLN
jgi:predicted HTH transcriptional regulator